MKGRLLMKRQLLLGFLGFALLLAGCSTMEKPMAKEPMAKESSSMMKDGVFMKDGKVMETMGGKTTDLMKDVVLHDGTKIMMDGTVVMKDGSKAMLKNGEMYDMDGMKSMVDSGM
jgi:hypothetical protein